MTGGLSARLVRLRAQGDIHSLCLVSWMSRGKFAGGRAGLYTRRVGSRGTITFICARMARVRCTLQVPEETHASGLCGALFRVADLACAVLNPEGADASVFVPYGMVMARFVRGSDIAPEKAYALGLPVLITVRP